MDISIEIWQYVLPNFYTIFYTKFIYVYVNFYPARSLITDEIIIWFGSHINEIYVLYLKT